MNKEFHTGAAAIIPADNGYVHVREGKEGVEDTWNVPAEAWKRERL